MKDILVEFSNGEQIALRKETEHGYILDKRYQGKDTAANLFMSYEQLCHLLLEEGVQDNIVCTCMVPEGEWHI